MRPDVSHQTDTIQAIPGLRELNGYEIEAKKRGITGDEMRAIHQRRIQLTPKKRKR
ncbi:MAG: hypothetical protein JKY94_09195 [Rhodobacteraceae bacterium]|nr:hypothetical protein [Paracoccaceae bacterium]